MLVKLSYSRLTLKSFENNITLILLQNIYKIFTEVFKLNTYTYSLKIIKRRGKLKKLHGM